MGRDRILAAPALGRTRVADAADTLTRTTTGVRGLDALLDGGFPAHRAIVVCGREGTGKTTLGLQFLLDGLHVGEPGAFVSADEKPRHLVEDAATLGYDLTDVTGRGVLVLLDASPYFTALRAAGAASAAEDTAQRRLRKLTGHLVYSGVDAREVASDLAAQVRRIGARRLVVDSITSLVPPDLDRARTHDYLRSIVQSLEDNLGCTTLLTCRSTRADSHPACEAARYLASGILELRLRRSGPELTRTLCLRKMRGTAIEPAEYPIAFERGGLALQDTDSVPAAMPQLAVGNLAGR